MICVQPCSKKKIHSSVRYLFLPSSTLRSHTEHWITIARRLLAAEKKTSLKANAAKKKQMKMAMTVDEDGNHPADVLAAKEGLINNSVQNPTQKSEKIVNDLIEEEEEEEEERHDEGAGGSGHGD